MPSYPSLSCRSGSSMLSILYLRKGCSTVLPQVNYLMNLIPTTQKLLNPDYH